MMHDPASGVAAGPRRSGGRTALLAAIGVLLLFVVGGAALMVAYWPKITAVSRQAASLYGDINRVQAAVQKQSAAEQVKAEAFYGARHALRITVINPPDWDTIARDPKAASAREKARALAVTARQALSAGRSFESYEIVYTQKRGTGISFSTEHEFVFREADLR